MPTAAPPAQPVAREVGGPLYSRGDAHPPVSGPRAGRVRPALGRWARWGWLGTTAALGAMLVATAWIGRQRARAASSTLDRGQSEVLLESLRQSIRQRADWPDAARLDSLLGQHAEGGLRYLALIDSDGLVMARAGTPVAGAPRPPIDFSPRPPVLEDLGSRLRMFAFVLPARPPNGDGRPRVRPAVLEVEFEPLVARQLTAEATRTFLLSTLVAAALVVAALIFWRLSILQELTERRLEQQRRLGILGEMSAVLAHEIRNPLASLKGHAQLLAERLGAGTTEHDKAALVVREARRLEILTTDLLDFARSGPIERADTDPAALLEQCAREVEDGAFAVHTTAAPRTWSLDEVRMRQALTNVLRNARQATPAGRLPEARVAEEAGALVFTVRDLGEGIAPGDEARIFAPFYTTRTNGTGLGLAVAQRVVEMHGGTITAANHPDGGAVFRLAIPA